MKSANLHQKIYTSKRKANLEKIKRLVNLNQKKLKILDLGVGDGKIATKLLKKGHQVMGIDINPKALKKAKQKGIPVFKADIEQDLTFLKQKFDLVLLTDVLEHLVDLKKVIQNIEEILLDQGELLICFPNHFDLKNRLRIILGKGIVHWDHLDFSKAYSYEHLRFLTYEELLKLFKDTKFKLIKRQFNFMLGGLFPKNLIPRWLRVWLLKISPNLFSGKFVILLQKNDKKQHKTKLKSIYLNQTPIGL
jgi:methionine biosynthesis protein MetW